MLAAPKPGMPPLNALKHFEAAARHASFVRAADELGVSASAVAQQVKILEGWLGKQLFVRHPQGVALTDEARLALPALVGSFESLAAAVQTLRSVTGPRQVRIAALPCVAQIWLQELLPSIHPVFADLEISITAMEQPPNFARDLFDFAIFFLAEEPAESHTIWLPKDNLFPVCSPSLGIKSAEDLRACSLLHDTGWKRHWRLWLDASGAHDIDANRGPDYSLYSIALRSAIDGAGVMIGRGSLVRRALETGQLVAPFRHRLPAPDRLAILVPKNRALPPVQSQLINWLRTNSHGG